MHQIRVVPPAALPVPSRYSSAVYVVAPQGTVRIFREGRDGCHDGDNGDTGKSSHHLSLKKGLHRICPPCPLNAGE